MINRSFVVMAIMSICAAAAAPAAAVALSDDPLRDRPKRVKVEDAVLSPADPAGWACRRRYDKGPARLSRICGLSRGGVTTTVAEIFDWDGCYGWVPENVDVRRASDSARNSRTQMDVVILANAPCDGRQGYEEVVARCAGLADPMDWGRFALAVHRCSMDHYQRENGNEPSIFDDLNGDGDDDGLF